jgi:hypothetical protein
MFRKGSRSAAYENSKKEPRQRKAIAGLYFL